jgi:hypothetical protein
VTCKLQTPSTCLILNLKLLFISYLSIYLFSIYLFDEWIIILCRFCNSILGNRSIGLVRCFEDIHEYLCCKIRCHFCMALQVSTYTFLKFPTSYGMWRVFVLFTPEPLSSYQ